jgi:ABC-type polysaccharide/polyol phosphate export permease
VTATTTSAPSSGSLTHRRDLFVLLVRRQLWLRRKRSALAQVYPVLSPFLLMVLYAFVFNRVFTVQGVERYADYLLAGLLPWAFLTVAVSRATGTVSSESSILRKAPMPAEFLPLSAAATYAIDFTATLGIFVAWLGVRGEVTWTALPGIVFPMAGVLILVMALVLVVSLIDVYTHDLRHILGNLLTVWFFLIPIVYRPNMAPEWVRHVRAVDPMQRIVAQMRTTLHQGRWGDPLDIVVMLGFCLFLFGAALALFRHHATDLPKEV